MDLKRFYEEMHEMKLQGYSLSESEELIPYERDIYYMLQRNYLEMLKEMRKKLTTYGRKPLQKVGGIIMKKTISSIASSLMTSNVVTSTM